MGWGQMLNFWGDTIALDIYKHIVIRTVIAEKQYGVLRGVIIPYQ